MLQYNLSWEKENLTVLALARAAQLRCQNAGRINNKWYLRLQLKHWARTRINQQKALSPAFRRMSTTDLKENHSGISSSARKRRRNSVPDNLTTFSPRFFASDS